MNHTKQAKFYPQFGGWYVGSPTCSRVPFLLCLSCTLIKGKINIVWQQKQTNKIQNNLLKKRARDVPSSSVPNQLGPILSSHGFTHFLLSLWKTWIATNTKTNKQTKFKKGARDAPSPSAPTQLGPILGSHAPSPKMHFKAKPGRRWWWWLQRPWWWNLLWCWGMRVVMFIWVFRFKTVDTP